MTPVKRVAVIGAGVSGLPAIKYCRDGGLDVVCFERSCDYGGLWRYTEQPVEGESCVMKSTIINTSKEMSAFSDFPPPAWMPNYMHNKHVLEYIRMYANKFDLSKHILFDTEVVSLKQADDYSTTGRWLITHKNIKTHQGEKTETFDAVLICSGHHADKNMPSFEGLERFEGKVVHAHDFRRPRDYEDKNVVVVGIGNSGGDVAVELSKLANQVYLSTRRGSWLFNRVNEKGLPLDIVFSTRSAAYIKEKFPNFIAKQTMKQLNRRFDHALYSLQPSGSPFSHHPTINDELPNRIIAGTVKVKDNISSIEATTVNFVDGTKEEDVDAIILATGYSFGFPFLDKKVLDVTDNRISLYKMMFPPDLEKMTLAVIGCFQPLGSILPMSELQCRVAVAVFKGDTILPSRDAMWADIKEKQEMRTQRYVSSPRHTIQVDYVPFMNELAQIIGCNVNYTQLMFQDPALAMKVMFGPVYPYHYRLFGPDPWPGARDAIMGAWDRICAPLQTRQIKADDKGNDNDGFLILMAVVFVLVAYSVIRVMF